MSLKEIAQQTVEIMDQGRYMAPSGQERSIAEALTHAKSHTRLYEPEQLARLLREGHGESSGERAHVEVWAARTQEAARRLAQDEGVEDAVVLNFASARNPGYECLLTAPAYYARNRAQRSMLYTDHMIYSPRVPFFRERSHTVLERPFCASVLTAPAPNAGEHLKREPNGQEAIEEALRRRTGYVLAVAQAHGHLVLVLGAWGCGVFGNDPHVVADTFGTWLEQDRFRGAFDRVIFAIHDRATGQPNLRAFEQRLAHQS